MLWKTLPNAVALLPSLLSVLWLMETLFWYSNVLNPLTEKYYCYSWHLNSPPYEVSYSTNKRAFRLHYMYLKINWIRLVVKVKINVHILDYTVWYLWNIHMFSNASLITPNKGILYYLKWFVRHASQTKWTWTKSVSCPWSHHGWTNKKYKLFFAQKTPFCGHGAIKALWCTNFLLKSQCRSEPEQNNYICIFFMAEAGLRSYFRVYQSILRPRIVSAMFSTTDLTEISSWFRKFRSFSSQLDYFRRLDEYNLDEISLCPLSH